MFQLHPLPYPKNALEPVISAQTLELHHGRHHQTYVNQLNALLETQPAYQGLSLEKVIEHSAAQAHQAIFNNSAQVWNHDFYWNSLSPEAAHHQIPQGSAFEQHFLKTFGNLESFQEQYIEKGLKQFASGWVWLIHAKNKNALEIVSTSNALVPWIESGVTPLLVLDVWEHAYYVDYQNQRKAHLEQVMKLLNWTFAAQQYDAHHA